MANGHILNPDLDFVRQIRAAGGDTVNKCYQCATCSTVCKLSPADKPFPRKEMLMAQWGQRDQLIKDVDLWLCYQCNDCSVHCPRGAKPSDVLAAARAAVYQGFAVPSFMGKLVARPIGLLPLLILPALLLLACIFAFAPMTETGEFVFMTSEVIDFDLFLPHSSVDGLFVLANILIFLMAAIGFKRFWSAIQLPDAQKQMGFIPAAMATVKEILMHNRFNDCEANKARITGHMLLVYGFIGAMITTGAVFAFVFIPHYLHLLGLESMKPWFSVPINIPHPVKFLGAFSGMALMVGGLLLILRRLQDPDKVGANGYPDSLFLYVIFAVGLTGMLSWLIRVSDFALAAYIAYYIHLLAVAFLLWYMPYSKFAHMIYRTLGLIYARQIGRESRGVMS